MSVEGTHFMSNLRRRKANIKFIMIVKPRKHGQHITESEFQESTCFIWKIKGCSQKKILKKQPPSHKRLSSLIAYDG